MTIETVRTAKNTIHYQKNNDEQVSKTLYGYGRNNTEAIRDLKWKIHDYSRMYDLNLSPVLYLFDSTKQLIQGANKYFIYYHPKDIIRSDCNLETANIKRIGRIKI